MIQYFTNKIGKEREERNFKKGYYFNVCIFSINSRLRFYFILDFCYFPQCMNMSVHTHINIYKQK